MAWNVDIDTADVLVLDDDELALLNGEIKRHVLLVWESTFRLTTSFYGGGDKPPPMLAELAERSAASRRKP